MQRQRGELVPIGAVISGLDWTSLVPASIPAASPQARHHFTLADQVDPLGLRPAKRPPTRGFMARTMALCSLPRTNPGRSTIGMSGATAPTLWS